MRFRSIFLGLMIGLPLLFGVGAWLLDRQNYQTTDDAYLKANMVLISPKVQGYVTQLFIEDNQPVKKDDVLLMIDESDYLARAAQVEALIEEETAHIKRLQMQKALQRAHIAGADAAIAAVQARREQVQKDLQRFNNLIDRGSAARQSLDKIQSESRQTAAELRGSEASAIAEQNQLSMLDVEIAETHARLKSLEAQLQVAKLDLEHTRVKAPFDGIIGNKGVQLGQLVQPGLSLASLVENQKIWVEANFKETQLSDMRPGQSVTIAVDAYPDLALKGKVESFAPASGAEFSLLPPENATGNFTKIVRRVPVKIQFDSDADIRLLKPGLSVTVKVKVH